MLRWLVAWLLLGPLCAVAAPGDAAHFFIYRLAPGAEAKFEEGYRQHLQWHQDHHDPLAWYGWTIEDGERDGFFVDASVGEPFAAFDHRVDVVGDGADFKAHVAPFATPMGRPTYVLLRGLSLGTPLEDHRPSARMQVTYVQVRPGYQAQFERSLEAWRRAIASMSHAPAHTWYRLVSGGEQPQYMLVVARDDWSGFDTFEQDVPAVLKGNEGALRDYQASVSDMRTEMWRYRAELSLLPAAVK